MKHLTSFMVFAAIALLITGCAAPEAPAPAGGSPTPSPSTPPPVVETPPPAPVVDTNNNLDGATLDALPKDLADIIRKGLTREEAGYSYLYRKLDSGSVSQDATNNAKIYQKGAIRKAVYAEEVQLDRGFWLYFYVMDSKERSVTGYCTRRDCGGVPDAAPRTLAYATYAFTTPSEWLSSMRSIQKLGEETVGGRSTFKTTATINGNPATVWIDRYSGLPLQVETGGSTYLYTDVALGVAESELRP